MADFDPYQLADEDEDAVDQATATPLVPQPSPEKLAMVKHVVNKSRAKQGLPPLEEPKAKGSAPKADSSEDFVTAPEMLASTPAQQQPEKDTTLADTTQLPSDQSPYPALPDPRPLIQAARQKEDKARQGALLAHAGETFASMATGKPDHSFSKELEGQAAIPAKRAEEDIALERLAQQNRLAQMQADPSSPRNRALQKAAYALLKAPPGSLDNLTEGQLTKLDPIIAQKLRNDAELEMRKTLAGQTAQYHQDELTRQQNRDEDRKQAASDALDYKKQHDRDMMEMRKWLLLHSPKKGAGKGDTSADSAVPGLERDVDDEGNPTVGVKHDEVKKLREGEANYRTTMSQVDRLDELFSKYGPQPLPSAAQAEMKGILANLGPQLYHQAGLNRFNDKELETLQRQIGDPTSLKEFVNPRFQQLLGDYRQSAKIQQDNNRAVLGYHEKAKPAGDQTQPSPSAGKQTRVRKKGDTGPGKLLDAATAQKYLTDPRFEEVRQ